MTFFYCFDSISHTYTSLLNSAMDRFHGGNTAPFHSTGDMDGEMAPPGPMPVKATPPVRSSEEVKKMVIQAVIP